MSYLSIVLEKLAKFLKLRFNVRTNYGLKLSVSAGF